MSKNPYNKTFIKGCNGRWHWEAYIFVGKSILSNAKMFSLYDYKTKKECEKDLNATMKVLATG